MKPVESSETEVSSSRPSFRRFIRTKRDRPAEPTDDESSDSDATSSSPHFDTDMSGSDSESEAETSSAASNAASPALNDEEEDVQVDRGSAESAANRSDLTRYNAYYRWLFSTPRFSDYSLQSLGIRLGLPLATPAATITTTTEPMPTPPPPTRPRTARSPGPVPIPRTEALLSEATDPASRHWVDQAGLLALLDTQTLNPSVRMFVDASARGRDAKPDAFFLRRLYRMASAQVDQVEAAGRVFRHHCLNSDRTSRTRMTNDLMSIERELQPAVIALVVRGRHFHARRLIKKLMDALPWGYRPLEWPLDCFGASYRKLLTTYRAKV